MQQGYYNPDNKTREKQIYKTRKLQVNISDGSRCKNSQKNISKPNPTVYKKNHTHNQVGFISESQGWFTYTINQCDTPH